MTVPPAALDDGKDCLVRSILPRIGSRWTTLVISNLAAGPLRFTEIKRRVEGIGQRTLTEVLRGLERDGLVTRTVYPTMPLKVEYALTPLGETLLHPVQALMGWAHQHRSEVVAARNIDAAR